MQILELNEKNAETIAKLMNYGASQNEMRDMIASDVEGKTPRYFIQAGDKWALVSSEYFEEFMYGFLSLLDG